MKLYTEEQMMTLAGWMAAADPKRPVAELREEAEAYISKLIPANQEKQPNEQRPICGHCKGKGTVEYKSADYECPVCHGEGKN